MTLSYNKTDTGFHKTIVSFFVLIFLLILFLVVPKGADEWVIWPCLLIFYFYFLTSIRKPIIIVPGIPTFFKIEVFFLLFYFILFYLPYQKYVLGLYNLKENFFLQNTYIEYTNISILACTIGLISFMEGIQKKIYLKKKYKIKEYSQVQYNKLFNVVFIFLIILLAIFSLTGLQSYLVNTYTGSDTGDTTTNGIYFIISVFMLFLSGFSLMFYKKFNKFKYFFYVLCLSYSILLLISGDRNTFFIIAVSLVAGFYTYVKKINRLKIILYVFAALYLYQIIEISRNSEERGLNAIVSAMSVWDETTTDDKVDKSSFSITTTATRIGFVMVPEKIDYFYGKFKIIGIAGIIPYSRSLFVDPKDKFVTSTDVLILGSGTTWSVGSSIIADIYVDFGILGVIILMYFLGYFANFIQQKAQLNNNSIKWGVLYLITFSLYSQISRYSFDFIARFIFWTFLIFWIFENTNVEKKINQLKNY
jgi:hypothetical protein